MTGPTDAYRKVAEELKQQAREMEERAAKGLCEYCGTPAELVADPFIAEVHGETVMRRLCDFCKSERADDI